MQKEVIVIRPYRPGIIFRSRMLNANYNAKVIVMTFLHSVHSRML